MIHKICNNSFGHDFYRLVNELPKFKCRYCNIIINTSEYQWYMTGAEYSRVKHLNPSHTSILRCLAASWASITSKPRYLELGIGYGITFNEAAPLFTEAWAVDKDEHCYYYINRNINLRWHKAATDDFFRTLDPSIKFDFIFIDALHEYDSVTRDFENSFQALNGGGFILLHDMVPNDVRPQDTAHNLVSDLEIKKTIQFVLVPGHAGIAIVRKK